MRYIQIFKTIEAAQEAKRKILSEKSEISHKFIFKVVDGNYLVFNDTDWKFDKTITEVTPAILSNNINQDNIIQKNIISQDNIEWAEPTEIIKEQPQIIKEYKNELIFNYKTESQSTKELIKLLCKHRMLAPNHNYREKNIYTDDILNITSLNNLICGNIKNNIPVKPEINTITDLSCIEKFEALSDISGISSNKFQNFFYIPELEKIRLPKTLKVIGESAFAFCTKLNNIIIPINVEEVKSRAFFGCFGLNKIEFPKTLKKLGDNIFSNSNITMIILNSLIPPAITEHTFDGMQQNYIICVPRKSYDEYVKYWKHLENKIMRF